MNRTVKILLPILLLVAAINLLAQQKTVGKNDKQSKLVSGKKVFMPPVYLGNYQCSGGPLKKAELEQLLHHQLTSKDADGTKYKILEFTFTYAEAQMYEDSIGNPLFTTDYASEYCPGDTVSASISANMPSRLKPGDSVFFDRIKIVRYAKNGTGTMPDTTAFEGKPFKCYVTR